jgi:uncharacterized protein DUF6516
LTIHDYFDRVHRVVADNSLQFEEGFEMLERTGSRGLAGRVRGRLVFTERTFLDVMERVEIRGGEPVPLSYAYYLILDGEELWAHENDPTHPMPVHRHDSQHRRHPDEERTLSEVIAKAWDTVSDEDFWAGEREQA